MHEAPRVIESSPICDSLSATIFLYQMKHWDGEGESSTTSISKIGNRRFKTQQYSLPQQKSLAVGVPVVNAAAHFGRVACYHCESWHILFPLSASI